MRRALHRSESHSTGGPTPDAGSEHGLVTRPKSVIPLIFAPCAEVVTKDLDARPRGSRGLRQFASFHASPENFRGGAPTRPSEGCPRLLCFVEDVEILYSSTVSDALCVLISLGEGVAPLVKTTMSEALLTALGRFGVVLGAGGLIAKSCLYDGKNLFDEKLHGRGSVQALKRRIDVFWAMMFTARLTNWGAREGSSQFKKTLVLL